MGLFASKPETPNNPMAVGIQKRQKRMQRKKDEEKKERQRIKEEKRREKAEAKKIKNQTKLGIHTSKPIPPTIPIRPNIIKSDYELKVSDYELKVKMKLKDQLVRDSSTFVLNQVLLCPQFFKNYEREISESQERNEKQAKDKTEKISEHSKHVLLPDSLQDSIDKRIKFVAEQGANKRLIQPLTNQTMYIVHENIEIIKPSDVDSETIYNTINERQTYKIVFDSVKGKFNKVDKKTHTGYYRLRTLEIIKLQNDPKWKKENEIHNQFTYNNNNHNEDDDDDDYDDGENHDDSYDDIEDDDDESPKPITVKRPKFRDSIAVKKSGHNQRKIRDSIVILKPNTQFKHNLYKLNNKSSKSPTPSPPSSEYDYAYITALNTRRPLSLMRTSNSSDEPLSTTILPNTCFSIIKVPMKNSNISDSDDEIQYEQKQSFNSKGFLTYFINMFQETLAKDLGFTADDLSKATWRGASIFIDSLEIIPAIYCDWPDKVALQWSNRPRVSRKNILNGKTYQWPTQEMIKKVKSLGCQLIPIGYAPKIGTNIDREYEWKLVFPAAEQYLETCLTSSQTKIYTLTKVLIKTFVEPYIDQKSNMFTTEHIRTHLFWECENNFGAWPEEYLGETLLRFLNTLLDKISTHRLPDYFLQKRNLLENIPEKSLVEIHKRIFRITENPVMHVLIALRNIKSIDTNFYPIFKYKTLFRYLIIDDPLKFLNTAHMKIQEKKNWLSESEDDENETVAVGMIGYIEKKPKSKAHRKVGFDIKNKRIAEQKKQNEEIIDTSMIIDKSMKLLRRQLVFKPFIEHFIEMSKASIQYRALNQSLIYLTQAERLCNILLEDRAYLSDIIATKNLDEIKLLKVNTVNEIHHENDHENRSKPVVPKRDSLLDKLKPKRKSTRILEDYDPYTNIDSIKSSITITTNIPPKRSVAIQPADYSDSDDEDYHTEHRKISFIEKGTNPNGMNSIQIAVQVHGQIEETSSNKDLTNNHFSSNGKKHSIKLTKSASIPNGVHDESEESDSETTL